MALSQAESSELVAPQIGQISIVVPVENKNVGIFIIPRSKTSSRHNMLVSFVKWPKKNLVQGHEKFGKWGLYFFGDPTYYYNLSSFNTSILIAKLLFGAS